MSEELEHDIEQLATADRHIADAGRALSEQMLRIDRMRENGDDVTSFKAVLARIDRTLIEWRAQRDIIVARMGRKNA